MRRPFSQLVRMVDEVFANDEDVTLGELASRWDEDIHRVMDAVDTHKMLYDDPGQLVVGPFRD